MRVANALLCMLFLLISCSKDPTVLLLSQEFKDYCVFKKDSYWIYINDSTGERDSAYVKSEPSVYFSDNPPWLEETVTVSIISTFIKNYYLRHWCSTEIPNTLDENSGALSIYLSIPNNIGGPYPAMWYGEELDVDLPNPCICKEEYCTYIRSELIPELNVGGNKFQDVLHTCFRSRDTTLTNPNAYTHNFYFVKHIGLIRFQENSNKYKVNRSYTLLTYDVRQ